MRRSKFWPEETVVVSISGDSAVTVISLGELTDLQLQRQTQGLTDGQRDAGLGQGLEPLQLDANRVGAGLRRSGLEVALAVGDQLLRLTRVGVRNSHHRAGNDTASVLDDAVDIAASLLGPRGQRRQHARQEPDRYTHPHGTTSCFER